MAQTSGSSSWMQLGAAALGGVLSYETGQANNVPNATQSFNRPDVASLYYGANVANQPTVGYAAPGTPTAAAAGGMSTTEMLIIGGVVIAAVAAFFFLRR